MTDSTASIPVEVADQLGISTIQQELQIGEERNDERRVPHEDLAQAMRDAVPVDTAPPPPPAFFWTYLDATSAGAEAILSVHLSEELSRTCESARTAANDVNTPVHVVDSRMTGLSLGYAVIAAAEAASAGATVEGVRAVLDQRRRSTTQLMYVDTLEYLRRGGRIGRAQAALGQALSVKPVLILNDGTLDQHARGMGTDRALNKAIATAVDRADRKPVDLGVEHFQTPERAEYALAELQRRIPQVRRSIVAESSGVLGAHTGPGALGITVSPTD